MTYGLVPRIVNEEGELTVHWDDPEAPRADVVIVRPQSTYQFPAYSGANVSVAREFLEDYATIRQRALIQVYYAQRSGPLTDQIRQFLGEEEIQQFHLSGRLVDIRRNFPGNDPPVLVQVWGVRMLLPPSMAPISAGQWDYGILMWPGISQPMTKEAARHLGTLDVAYVNDRVLNIYEGHPEFSIHPESGGVSHGYQWSVSSTRRVGRDLIAVDLKKLYEGNRSDTVRHWHSHAVLPPANLSALRQVPNVGTRSRRMVYGVIALGERLAELATPVLQRPVTAAEVVGLDRTDLDYHGWWTGNHVEPITRHIPLDLSRDTFLSRCNDLNKLVIEGLAEGRLRTLLVSMGIPSDDIKGWRSLRLLDLILQLAHVASQTALSIQTDAVTLYERVKNGTTTRPAKRLFALNELRQLADHRAQSSGRRRFDDALKDFDLDRNAQATGWGWALDRVYDGVAEDLEDASQILATGIHTR